MKLLPLLLLLASPASAGPLGIETTLVDAE